MTATSNPDAASDDVEADADLPAPFHEQMPFLWNQHRYYGYVSGVGAGKTFAGVMRTGMNMEYWNPGEMGAIVAPTATMVKDVILPEMRELGLLQRWEYKSPHTDEPGLHAPNGARALILSADNQRTIERLAGLNLAWFWLDEASRVPERALEILEQRLRVGQYRNAYLTTTPMGRDHVHDFFVGSHDPEYEEYGEAELAVSDDRLAILRVPTHANPHTAEDYKEQMDAKEGQVYEREILGRFVDYEGLVYPWFTRQEYPEGHVLQQPRDEDLRDVLPGNVRKVFYGVDWGFSNPSVVVAVAELQGDQYAVIDEFHETRVTVDDLAGVIEGMQEYHQPGPIYCDPAEPASIEALQRHGLDAVQAANDVMPGLQHVTALRDDLVVLEHCQELINEFGLYRYADDGDSDKPVTVNDHAMDALRYALFTEGQRGGQNFGMLGADPL